MQKEIKTEGVVLSMERIIELVKSLRNDLIRELLDQDKLDDYFAERFSKPLSRVRKEFALRELKELAAQPVDLVHYAKLISQMRDTNTASISKENHTLFFEQLDSLLKKYNY